MLKLLSLVALVGGLWLIYLGYERQQSLAGKAADSLSRIGRTIDGGDHPTTQTEYYVCGALLLVGGAFGLGIIRK